MLALREAYRAIIPVDPFAKVMFEKACTSYLKFDPTNYAPPTLNPLSSLTEGILRIDLLRLIWGGQPRFYQMLFLAEDH